MSFAEKIHNFNLMYKLPVSAKPTLLAVGDPIVRLTAFKDILLEEVKELDLIIDQLHTHASAGAEPFTLVPDAEQLAILTELADFLGDVQVYCASEMAKFGLPLDSILTTIMASNFSKLGADGKPIYDERGKVLKGPGYWRPETAICDLLRAAASPGSDKVG